MSDPIDRQAAIDAIGALSDAMFKNIEKGATYPKRQWFDGMANAQSIIENLPSAQPKIIRCKDCKKRVYCRTSSVWAVAPSDNWYCADAERRENG